MQVRLLEFGLTIEPEPGQEPPLVAPRYGRNYDAEAGLRRADSRTRRRSTRRRPYASHVRRSGPLGGPTGSDRPSIPARGREAADVVSYPADACCASTGAVRTISCSASSV
jgi:hypothetical protein